MKDGFALSDSGKKALETGITEDGDVLSDSDMLMLEIMSRTPSISKENVFALYRGAIEVFGSPAAAIAALKTGALEIEKTGTLQ